MEKETNDKSKVTRKYLPYVFTKQRIAMLSGLLKNNIAVQVNINIMNAFAEIIYSLCIIIRQKTIR